jgi:hypothetical protein
MGYRWKRSQVCPGPPGPFLAASKSGLRRGLKGRKRTVILFTDATIIMEELMERACGYIQSLSPVERLQKAGVLSGKFWLAT